MIEWYDKEEFMKAPVELQSITETQNVLGPRGNILMPLRQERTVMLHIGDKEYDIRDLIYRLLRAEAEIESLVTTVSSLQTRMDQLADEQIDMHQDTDALEEYIKGALASLNS